MGSVRNAEGRQVGTENSLPVAEQSKPAITFYHAGRLQEGKYRRLERLSFSSCRTIARGEVHGREFRDPQWLAKRGVHLPLKKQVERVSIRGRSSKCCGTEELTTQSYSS